MSLGVRKYFLQQIHGALQSILVSVVLPYPFQRHSVYNFSYSYFCSSYDELVNALPNERLTGIPGSNANSGLHGGCREDFRFDGSLVNETFYPVAWHKLFLLPPSYHT
jgi:hypothetical protein